MRIRKITYL
ncbi:unnamed protein product, partial [Allacma fusca]